MRSSACSRKFVLLTCCGGVARSRRRPSGGSSACPARHAVTWVTMPPSVPVGEQSSGTRDGAEVLPLSARTVPRPRVKIPDPGRFHRFPRSSPPSDTQTGKFPANQASLEHAVRPPAGRWAAPPSPRGGRSSPPHSLLPSFPRVPGQAAGSRAGRPRPAACPSPLRRKFSRSRMTSLGVWRPETSMDARRPGHGMCPSATTS
jgi:hypothetical protein